MKKHSYLIRIRYLLIALFLSLGAPSSSLFAEEEALEVPEVVFFDLGNTMITKNRQWVPGVKEALDRIRNQGVRMGIISNTGSFSRLQLLLKFLPKDFRFKHFETDLVLLSSEFGFQKPASEIYKQALKKSGVSPSRVIYFDEGLIPVLGSQEAGLRSLLVDVEFDASEKVVRTNLPKLLKTVFPDQ